MNKELQIAKLNILKGDNITTEVFKLGFMACIESVEDLDQMELALKLRKQHKEGILNSI